MRKTQEVKAILKEIDRQIGNEEYFLPIRIANRRWTAVAITECYIEKLKSLRNFITKPNNLKPKRLTKKEVEAGRSKAYKYRM